MKDRNKPHCLSDDVKLNAFEIMQRVEKLIPENNNLYLIAGAMRNTMYYLEHGESLPQRDYDVVFVGPNIQNFTDNLKRNSFTEGQIQKADQKVYMTPVVEDPADINDYLVLDIGIYEHGDIDEIIKNKVNFTINSFYAELSDILKDNWLDNISSLSGARNDIKNKVLRLNPNQKADIKALNLHAAIRFASLGFSLASQDELNQMVADYIEKMPKEKFEKRVNKVLGYVGGEENALSIARDLGIEFNPFIYNELLKVRNRQ